MEATLLDSRSSLSVDGSQLTIGHTEENNDLGGDDSDSNDDSLLDEMDSYWEDLNARLTVSRMVTDSVIKGMVNAIEEEAAVKVGLKEAEVAILKHKLQYYEIHAPNGNPNNLELLGTEEPLKSKPDLLRYSQGMRQEFGFVKQVETAAEEQLQRLLQKTLDNSVSDQQREEDFQREIASVMVQKLLGGLQDDIESKSHKQQSHIQTLSMKWEKIVKEISNMREGFNVVYGSLFSSELPVSSHNTLESSEECNSAKGIDHSPWKSVASHSPSTFYPKETAENIVVIEKSDSAEPMPNESLQLKVMTKEQLIAYFKTEMTKMKRQHDLALQEKTEELFRLKRERLNEKGSSPLHFRKEKDIDLIRKIMSELMSKLDEILLENKKSPILYDNQDFSHCLKEKINNFFVEIPWLKTLLAGENKVARCAVLQASPMEANLEKEIEKLRLAIKEVKMETTIREDVHIILLKGLIGEIERAEGLEILRKLEEDNYSFLYRSAVGDSLTSINSMLIELYEEKNYISAEVLEKEKALCLEIEKNGRLMEELASLSTLLKDREKLASDSQFELLRQKEQFGMICGKLEMFTDQVNKQERIICNTKKESELLMFKLEETFQQIHHNEVERSNLNQKFKIVSEALDKVERQKNILDVDIQEKQEKLASVLTKEKEQEKKLEATIVSLVELSKAIEDCECRLTECMKSNESRLKMLSCQCSQLIQQANFLQKQVLWYQQRFQSRCQDLQKAETEVDLLGDEVDVLLDLLEKIYVALDHYSPVLQHYPGVVEILKLIRREMKGENVKLA